MSDGPAERFELTEFSWDPRDDGMHFTCEVLPASERIGFEGRDSHSGGERDLPRDVRRQVRGGDLTYCTASGKRLRWPASRIRRSRQCVIAPWSAQGKKRKKIDTEIRHVTKSGANLFLELGFTPAEAKRLQAASRKQINDTRLLKQQLMEELTVWIAKHHLKQAEAAEILMVSRPRVSDVVNKKTAKFTIDTLVEMLSRVGKPVKLAIL